MTEQQQPSAPAVAELAMVTLDCTDPRAEADFWSAVLGWPVAYADDRYAMLTGPGTRLGFGAVEGFQPPAWPDEHGAKHFHLDLAVADLAEAERRCTELGATVVEPQPADTEEGEWRVLRDPSGQLFCLTKAQMWQ